MGSTPNPAVTLTPEEAETIRYGLKVGCGATGRANQFGSDLSDRSIREGLFVLDAAEARAKEEADGEEASRKLDAEILGERRRNGVMWHGFYRVSTDERSWIQRARIVRNEKPEAVSGWPVRFELERPDGSWVIAADDEHFDVLCALFVDLERGTTQATGATRRPSPSDDGKLASRIVEGILKDLAGRSGIDHAIESIDDDVREEMEDDLVEVVARFLKQSP